MKKIFIYLFTNYMVSLAVFAMEFKDDYNKNISLHEKNTSNSDLELRQQFKIASKDYFESLKKFNLLLKNLKINEREKNEFYSDEKGIYQKGQDLFLSLYTSVSSLQKKLATSTKMQIESERDFCDVIKINKEINLQDKNRTLATLQDQLTENEIVITVKDKSIEILTKQVETKDKEIQTLTKQLEEKDKVLEDLTKQKDKTLEDLTNKDIALEDSYLTNQALTQELEEKDKDIGIRREILTNNEIVIQTLKETLTKQKEQALQDLTSQLREKKKNVWINF